MNQEILLYHITEAENVQKIKKRGLLPSLGNNSKLCGETEQRIFCCDYKSIPYWLLILRPKNPVLLRIKKNIREIEKFEYSSYQEYMLDTAVNPGK